MNNPFISLFQCGVFLLVPLVTIVAGVMYIIRRIGLNHRYSLLSVAVLLGFAFFEASFIGEVIDSRSPTISFLNLIKFASLVGIGSFIFIFVLTGIYRLALHIFKSREI